MVSWRMDKTPQYFEFELPKLATVIVGNGVSATHLGGGVFVCANECNAFELTAAEGVQISDIVDMRKSKHPLAGHELLNRYVAISRLAEK